MPQRIREARQALPLEAAQAAGQSGRLRIQLIDAGWGSSGYYSAELLESDGPTAFPAGTHMYLDHAGITEEHDRQGLRSVRDLAAVTTSDATYNPTTQALEADVQVLAPFRDQISELAPHVGLSITGSAIGETGEAEGRMGLVFSELTQGYSVDFVAHAGRGGRVLALMESARRPEHVREAYGLSANDLRSLLNDAVGEAFGGEGQWTYVCDYSDNGSGDWLVFNRDSSDADGTFQVTYTVADGDVSFTGDPVEVYAHTQYLPVGTPPPAQSVPTATTEDSTMPNIEEAELRSLRETAARATEAEQRATAAEQRATDAERQRDTLAAAGVARGRIDTALNAEEAADLPAAIRDRIRERVVSNLPLTEAGELDTAAFDTRVTEAITNERQFVATLAEQLGAGTPRGLGGDGGNGPTDTTALDKAQGKLAEAFKGFGMSDDSAAVAARGRH